MSEDFKALQQLFVNAGASVDPEEDLLWRTWEKPALHGVAVMNEIRHTMSDVSKSPGNTRSRENWSPLCNRIIHIFHKMEFVVKYFCGEFEVECKDKYFREQFANIWHEFIRGWYFGSIYVAYGEDFKRIDDMKLAKDGLDPELEGVPGRFRLYTRGQKGDFYSVLSKLSGIKFSPKQKTRIVKCECGGMDNWLYWWYLWIKWMDGMDRFEDSIKWLSKQAVLTPKNIIEAENIIQQGENTDPFLVRTASNPGGEEPGEDGGSPIGKTKFDEIEVMNNDTPLKIYECINRYFETHASHLGFAGKVQEQKKERINAGENFPYQKIVSNIRTHLLNSLNLCIDRMRAKFGEKVVPQDVRIVPTNQAFAQGLPEKQFGGSFMPGDLHNDTFKKQQFLFHKQQQLDKKMGND